MEWHVIEQYLKIVEAFYENWLSNLNAFRTFFLVNIINQCPQLIKIAELL